MDETLDPKIIAELTTEIVSAYVAHHNVAVADVPPLIGAVGKRMAALTAGEAKPAEPPKPEPAVPARRSVTPEYLTCLVCGQRVKTLRRHLRMAHGLTPQEYRETFGLGRDYPMIASAYAERRAEIARRIGLGGARQAPQPAPQPAPSRRGRRKARAGKEPALA